MTPELQAAATEVEDRLRAVMSEPSHDAYARRNAEEYLDRVSGLRGYLESRSHSAVLIGAKGSGKSGLLAALTGLTIGEKPNQGKDFHRWAVLPVGSGGTTVCEIRVRSTNDKDCPNRNGADYGLTIIPLETDSINREIDLFAEALWADARGPRPVVDGQSDEALDPERIRVIRGITGCTIRKNPDRTQPAEDPADVLVRAARDLADLKTELRRMAKLHERTQTEWWPIGSRDECLQNIKATLANINSGRELTAGYPKVITLWIPATHRQLGTFDIVFTDSKGYTDRLESRADLQGFLKDDRCVYLLCTRFEDTPGEFRDFLKTVQRVEALSQAADRIRILIMDHDKAEQVTGADGDRVFGQILRKADCQKNLAAHNLERFVGNGGNRILAFDTLQDDLEDVRALIDSAITGQREANTHLLEEAVRAGNELLANLQTAEVTAMQEVDKRLLQAFEGGRPAADRLDDVVSGITALLGEHPARVRAMCRRDGEYLDMNAYAAVEIAVQEWFQKHYRDLDTAMETTFRALENDDRFTRVAHHVRQRRTNYNEKKSATGMKVAAMISRELRTSMPRDTVWRDSSAEWTQGQGFRDRVRGHIESFGRKIQQQNPTVFQFTPVDFGLPVN